MIKKAEFTHKVLGAPYKVKIGDKDFTEIREENMGECQVYAKKILVSTEVEDCNEKELEVRTKEIIAHELLHAYLNEAGVDLESEVEERLASFFMKNHEKLSKSISDICGSLDIK